MKCEGKGRVRAGYRPIFARFSQEGIHNMPRMKLLIAAFDASLQGALKRIEEQCQQYVALEQRYSLASFRDGEADFCQHELLHS